MGSLCYQNSGEDPGRLLADTQTRKLGVSRKNNLHRRPLVSAADLINQLQKSDACKTFFDRATSRYKE